MTKFVLEILDGDRAGTVVPLGEGRTTIGRHPDNDLVLPDEKCSGHHATIEFEDGGHVLRDQDSTNGTLLDGHRVSEVALSPGDVVQLGRIRLCYRDPSAAVPEQELSLGQIDTSRLGHAPRRRGTMLLVALIVVSAGVGAWLAYGGGLGEAGVVGGPGDTAALRVADNLLPQSAADFETDGAWEMQVLPESVPFDLVIGRALVNSGSAALGAVGVTAEDGEPPRFALARLREPLRVTPDTPLQLSAQVWTFGTGRALVRVLFSSSVDDRVLRSGTAALQSDDIWQRFSLDLRSPPGFDRMAVEVLALLPDRNAEVRIDDLALQRGGDAAAMRLSSGNGRVLRGVGGSICVDGPVEPTLLAVTPLVDDPALQQLAAAGLLVPSDVGRELAVELVDEGLGFALRYRAAAGGAGGRGLRVSFPVEAAPVRSRGVGEDAVFVEQAADFEAGELRDLLLGTAEGRCLLRFDPPVTAKGSLAEDEYRLDIPGCFEFELRVRFPEAALRSRELGRDAKRFAAADQPAAALAAIRELVDRWPLVATETRAALTLRQAILAEQEQRVRQLERDATSASFFDARVGYERVIGGLDALFDAYGAFVQRRPELEELRAAMVAGIAELDRRAGLIHSTTLRGMVEMLEQGGQPELSAAVRDYIERNYASLQGSDEPEEPAESDPEQLEDGEEVR